MKPRVAFVSALIAGLLGASAFGADAPSFPPHTIGNSQLRVLPRNADGREYQLHIGLPASYANDKDRRYPVVFVTDGYWDFEKINVIRGSLVYDKVVPEFIIVGLGYPGEGLDYDRIRGWELSPVPINGDAQSGRAADFLRILETEIIPFVEREYRTDPKHRVLAGASLGGLFTLYAMYSKPEHFSGYIAATPAVVVGNDWLLGYEEKFAAKGTPLKTRLFVSGGGYESPGFLGAIQRYNKRVESRRHAGLAYQFRIVDGERHAGMILESYTRGLRFVFEPLAPETGPSR
ncbi:MAG TPA: alpha/beta hydrolase-fold protein [Opitutaceae bacterium]|nr:alpha/beta hydrolase-fold protein [Opitutaceae bacterium]